MVTNADTAGTPASFVWHDGERVICFGRGALADAARWVGPGLYAALTTERARGSAPFLVEGADTVHLVAPGNVDELAAEMRPRIAAATLVAIGGGRVIDVAKALAAADPPRRVVAIPTTLSGAEMTAIHRHATSVASGMPTVRPAMVINDPIIAASQPEAPMLASSLNALGHAAEAPVTVHANPVTTMVADRAADLIVAGIENLDRDRLALGALLGGYAIGGAAYGLHHVLSQTLVRYAGLGHGPANAVMLPHTARALADANPERGPALHRIASVAAAAGRRAGISGLSSLRVPEALLFDLAERASRRPELDLTPPRPSVETIEGIYRRAFEG